MSVISLITISARVLAGVGLSVIVACGPAQETPRQPPPPHVTAPSASPQSAATSSSSPPNTTAASVSAPVAAPPWSVPGTFAKLFEDGRRVSYDVTVKKRGGGTKNTRLSCTVRRTVTTASGAASCIDCGDFVKLPEGTANLCWVVDQTGLRKTLSPIEGPESVASAVAKPPLVPTSRDSYERDDTPEESGDLESYRVEGAKRDVPGIGPAYCVKEHVAMGGPFDDTEARWCITEGAGLALREYRNLTSGLTVVMRIAPGG